MINIRNDDNRCFRWCLGRHLNLLNKNSAKIRNDDREFAKLIHFKGTKFPVHKKTTIQKLKNNNISINVLGYVNKTPYCIHISKQTFEKIADLLLANTKN